MPEPPFDIKQAHKWFAIECNNSAWDLVEAGNRSEIEVCNMLHMAHSARYHWGEVGGTLNKLRADVLLASAYLVAGQYPLAINYANSAQRLAFETEEATAFDLASIAGAVAAAQQYLGNSGVEFSADFEHRLAEINEPGDVELLRKLYRLNS